MKGWFHDSINSKQFLGHEWEQSKNATVFNNWEWKMEGKKSITRGKMEKTNAILE